MYWIGQAFGILATVATIIVPVFKKKWQMLVVNLTGNVFLALNLIFLQEIGSGIFTFLVAIAQATVNLVHTLKDKKGRSWENTLFLVLYVCLGFYGLFTAPGFVPAINGKNLLELLPILGAVLNCLFVSTREEGKARLYFLACTSVWTVYNAIILSTSFFGTFVGVITSVSAIIKYRKKA